MNLNKIIKTVFVSALLIQFSGCKLPDSAQISSYYKNVPSSYGDSNDTINSGEVQWRTFFQDPALVALIDTALKNNQDVLIALQEMEVAKNKVRSWNSQLLPQVSAGAGAGLEKTARYTSTGAGNASTDITEGKRVPEPLGDYMVGLQTSWEVDIWSKLRNYKRAAYSRYLKSVEGKNFVVTNLVAEIANSYYELLALDNQLDIIRQAIQLQQNELDVVRVQKAAAKATELAVKQFEAQVFNSQSMEYETRQQIVETENRINFLLGRFPQPIPRDKSKFTDLIPVQVKTGIPSQLLRNRPDVRQAEQEVLAAGLDVKAARAEFYPSFGINGTIGFQAFKPNYLFLSPESFMYSLFAELTAPLINRNAIKAEFNTAKAYQLEALYDYQRSIINGYIEVSNQISGINNLTNYYEQKSKQVEALNKSIEVASELFKSAKADYLEVLTAQRDALESKMELIEAKERQFHAVTNVYKALGGGWR